MNRTRALALAAALLAAGCGRLSDDRAERLVRAYLAQTVDAYRKSDERLVEPVAGEDEARRIASLIGVKRDLGIALDATLVEFRVVRVERPAEEVVVHAEEAWTYVDRRIGTGEQVGPDSRDRYRLAYRLRREGDRWIVSRVDADAPPEVGRREEFPGTVGKELHRMETHAPPPRADAPPGKGRASP
jgi:hypothetical protein